MTDLISSAGMGGILKGTGVAILAVMSLLQIAPIRLNPWGWIARKIGRAINGEVIEKVDRLETEVKTQRAEAEEQVIINCRIRILRFGDEVARKVRHSKDHFDQILQDIDKYENYCRTHQDFLNSITATTVAVIKDVYKKQYANNDFN